MQIEYYIKGKKSLLGPANRAELSIELNFDQDIPQATVSTNRWRLVREDADIVIEHLEGGLSTGVGITEGLEFKIKGRRSGSTIDIFDGYLDTMGDVEYGCGEVSLNSVKRRGIDRVNETADGFSFEYLDGQGKVDSSKLKMIPYVISSIPNGRDILLTSLTLFVVTQELNREIEYYQEQLAKLGNPFTATELISTSLHILYTITLLIALVKIINDLVNYIIQPVKYHASMLIKDLFEIGAKELGYTFKSSIFDSYPWNKAVLLPEKYAQVDDRGILGFKKPKNDVQKGYFRGTFGDFIRGMKTLFKAKILIDGNVMYFERKDFSLSKPKYKIPDIRNDFYGLNTSEFKANYLIEFSTDINDKNTIKDYAGTSAIVTTRPVRVDNKDLVLSKDFERASIPYALAKRKESLTIPEEIIKVFLDEFSKLMNLLISGVNALISVANIIIEFFEDLLDALSFVGITLNVNFRPIRKIDPVDLGKLIDNRIGAMLLENDFVNVAKLLIIDESSGSVKIDANNSKYLNASYVYDNFHSVDSFVEINGKHNQYYKHRLNGIPFSDEDYEKVENENVATDKFGNFVIIDSLKWNPEQCTADIVYRINKKYTNNLSYVKTENTGF